MLSTPVAHVSTVLMRTSLICAVLRAAAGGEPAALFNLGVMHLSGLGAAANATKAAETFRDARAQGVPEAAESLGLLYYNGLGVPQDRARARCATPLHP